MSDFLLELRSEEIPARMQAGARADLEKLFRKEMGAAGLAVGEVTVWSTPRRLALIASALPEATAAVSEEVKGPRVGAPPQALEGFLRKTGLTEDQLTERDGVLFAISEKPGRATSEVLAEAIPAIVGAFPWPKSQRWGAASISTESTRWVRPLSGIVAIFGEGLVACEAGGIASGYATKGHRFHCPGEITIGSAADYQEKLRACHVIVDHAERQDLIRAKAKAAAEAAGLNLVEDEGLVIENAGLTEWPVPLLGRFDEEYLEVPPEVIQLTARTNQKYFVCEDAAGKLANAFVCTANIEASDGGVGIVAGNRKVLAARLSDARFFWQQDRKTTLEDQAKKLERITFHEKLGTVADKVERVAKLARWLVEEGIVSHKTLVTPAQAGAHLPAAVPGETPEMGSRLRGNDEVAVAELANQAELAARLCKADLVTEMVGEFPELQGLMGGYYARAEGLPDAVADAIADHYKPVGQGDDVPTAPVTVAVALADKLDTLVAFFAINERPTGSKDPFALRRAMVGVIDLLIANRLRVGVRTVLSEAYRLFITQLCKNRFCFVEEMDSTGASHPILGDESSYLPIDKQIVVLKKEPPQSIAEFDSTGKQVWAQEALREQKLVDYVVIGFVETILETSEFCFDRLRDREKRAGRRPDIVQSVMPSVYVDWMKELGLGSEPIKVPNGKTKDDIIGLLSLSEDLSLFLTTEDGTNLLAGYKRAANILKKEGVVPANAGTGGQIDAALRPEASGPGSEPGTTDNSLSYTPEPAEKDLIDALDAAGPKASDAVAAEDFAGAMAALASLRGPIDAFFDQVTVNDADPAKRAYRLSLLARLRDAVHGVADFSRIEG